ncbi:MAG: hypothetical protein KDA33_04555 [Phycisphaerales bacterium]|nr:hypothetical protein [Phycisphaerales bacterium]
MMAQSVRISAFMTLSMMFAVSGTPVRGDVEKMQPMTTVPSSQGVQVAQATTSRNIVAQDTPTGVAGDRANLASNGTTTARATSQPATAAGETPMYYVVQDVDGRPMYSSVSTDATSAGDANWKVIRIGDRLGSGVKILVPARSALKLVLEPSSPPMVMALTSGTQLAIEDLALRNGVAVARLALGVGAVKAGVAESGEIRSNMTISTPTGTLSKKGTDIFMVEYQNGRFRMSLSEQGRGLIQAIQLKFGSQGQLLGTRSRFVTRGQFVTQEMFKAIDHVRFDRNINVNDLIGMTGNELLTILNNRGFGFVLPIGENTVNILGSPNMQTPDGDTGLMSGVTTVGIGRATPRRDGDFGVGQTLLPIRSPLGSDTAGRRIVKTRKTDCAHDANGQCRGAKRVMKRRM